MLLLAVVAGLCAPLRLPLFAGGSARWWRAARRRRAERHATADAPRRLAALRASELGGLSAAALHSLAARARWLYPPRRASSWCSPAAHRPRCTWWWTARWRPAGPAIPAGTIRHRVGAGGVVGLAGALTGAAAALDWHTAGTTLLSLPASAVATAVGPLPGPPPRDRDEAEALFADTPALAALAAEERLALIAAAPGW